MQAALYGHLIDSDIAQLGRETPAALTQRFTTDFAFIREALTRLSTVFLRDIATALAVARRDVLDRLAGDADRPRRPAARRAGHRADRQEAAPDGTCPPRSRPALMASMVSESLAGARIAKTYGLEGYLKARARVVLRPDPPPEDEGRQPARPAGPILEIAGGIAVAAVLVFIGWRIVKGQTTIGDFTGFVTALLLAAQSMRTLGNLNACCRRRHRLWSASSACSTNRAKSWKSPARRRSSSLSGEISSGTCHCRYGEDAEALQRHRHHSTGRTNDGSGRALGLRQVDVSCRSCQGCTIPAKGRCSIDGSRLARCRRSPACGEQIAMVTQEADAVRRYRPGQYRAGRPDASQAEIEAAAARRRGARFHRRAAGGLRNAARRQGLAPVGRRAPAHCAGPSDPEGRADPATRRGHQRAGQRSPSGWCRTRWPA